MARARILIIDDDRGFRRPFAGLLKALGFEVIEAASGVEGLKRATQCSPDVIVLDLLEESSSGAFGIVQALKHQEEFRVRQNVPIVVVASDPILWEKLFRKAGAAEMICPDCYFTKPVDILKLLDVLEELLGQELCA